MNRYIFPIIAVAVLVFALVSLNRGMSTNAQPDKDDDDQQQSQQDKKAEDAAKNKPPSAQAQNTPAPPDELVLNDPTKAKYRIVAGWNYDSTNQSNQNQLSSTISALQNMAKNSHGQMSLQVVDVDVPDEARSAGTRGIHDIGVSVNGKPISNDNLGVGSSNPQTIMQSFAAAGH